MRFKRLLALLLAAALALSLLAGCGGGQQSVSQVLLNLLDGQYQNVSVEIDSDLEAKLRQAISESETDEELRAALERLLGGGISFQRLGSGQQGDSAWTLIIYPGTDPNAAARSVYLDLDKVFAALPDDGVYSSGFAMAEMENGYAILVKATVDKAGTEDKPDPVTMESIAVTTRPRTTYWVGESFDPKGMVITATYSNNTTRTLKDIEKNGDQGVKWTPEGALATTDTSVTITYGDKTTTVKVTVKEPEVKEIKVTAPTTTSYTAGQIFDSTGMKVTASYTYGSDQQISISECDLTLTLPDNSTATVGESYKFEKAGDYTLTVSYEGVKAEIPLTVNFGTVTRITVSGNYKKEYELNETFNPDGLVVTASDGHGNVQTIPRDDYTLAITDPNNDPFELSDQFTTAGEYTLTVEYNSITSNPITITVVDKGYTVSEDGKTYTVTSADGLLAWNEAVQKDMTLNCTLADNIDLTGETWTPIGDGSTYQGTFDGQGYSIKGLNASSLFGGIGKSATVKNLQLVDVNLNESSGVTAGIVANNYGTIMACSMTGKISAYSYTSGIANYNSGTIVACWFSGTLKENEGYGIVAYNYGTITACFWDGNTTNGYRSNEEGTVEATKVEGTITWQNAVDGMNNALTSNDYKWERGADGLPTLTKD